MNELTKLKSYEIIYFIKGCDQIFIGSVSMQSMTCGGQIIDSSVHSAWAAGFR